MHGLEDVYKVPEAGLALVHHEVAHQNQNNDYDGQFLFFGEPNHLQLSISVIGHEKDRVFKILDEQVIELIKLAYWRDLYEFFLDYSPEIKQQIVKYR